MSLCQFEFELFIGSPFNVNVKDEVRADKVKHSLVTDVRVGEQFVMDVDATEAGEADLQVQARDPHGMFIMHCVHNYTSFTQKVTKEISVSIYQRTSPQGEASFRFSAIGRYHCYFSTKRDRIKYMLTNGFQQRVLYE